MVHFTVLCFSVHYTSSKGDICTWKKVIKEIRNQHLELELDESGMVTWLYFMELCDFVIGVIRDWTNVFFMIFSLWISFILQFNIQLNYSDVMPCSLVHPSRYYPSYTLSWAILNDLWSWVPQISLTQVCRKMQLIIANC